MWLESVAPSFPPAGLDHSRSVRGSALRSDSAVPGDRGAGAEQVTAGQGVVPWEERVKSLGKVCIFASRSHFPFALSPSIRGNELQLSTPRFTGPCLFSALPVHKFMIALLDATHQDMCFSACGVLLNLTVDRDKHAILKESGGVKK